jgi:enoyl-CoA hydratase/carnithine racemase
MSWDVTHEGAVAVVSVDRPPKNLMSFALLRELDELLEEIGNDQTTAVVVITAARPGLFAGHADRDDLDKVGRGEIDSDEFANWLWTLRRIETIPQPVIAAVDGPAWGGGCELALACTLRIGSSQAEFCQMEIVRGAIPGAGASQRLPRLIGAGRAAEMILTGRPVGAQEAKEIGLLNALVDAPDFRAAALDWADELAGRRRPALVAAKRALYEGRELPLLEGLMHEQQLFLDVFSELVKELRP